MEYTKEQIYEILKNFRNHDPLPVTLPFDLKITGKNERNLYADDYLYPKYAKMDRADVFSGFSPPAKVLDLGFGSGCIPIYFLKKGFEVTAVNIDRKSIERMQFIKELYGFNLTLIEADITTSFDFRDFNLILLLGVIHHLKEDSWRPLIKNCYEALQENGAMVIETQGHIPCQELLESAGFSARLVRTAWHRSVYRGDK